jgi:hypothetical protein
MYPGELDLERLRIPTQLQCAPKRGNATHQPAGYFLKGPIPLAWLSRAAIQPGRALHVGVLLWFLAGLMRSREVPLLPSWLHRFGLNRFAAYRGLTALEKAGLVTVKRQRGRAPLVTLRREIC